MNRGLTESKRQELKVVTYISGCAVIVSFYVGKYLGYLIGPFVATILGGAKWYFSKPKTYPVRMKGGGLANTYELGFEAVPDYVGYALFLLLAVTILVIAKAHSPRLARNTKCREIPTLDIELQEIPSLLAQSPPQLITSYFPSKSLSIRPKAPLRPFFLSAIAMVISLTLAAIFAYQDPTKIFGTAGSPLRLALLLLAVFPGLGTWVWSLIRLSREHVPDRRLLIDQNRGMIEVVDLASNTPSAQSEEFALSDITGIGIVRYFEKDSYRSSYIKLNRRPGQEALGILSSAEESASDQAAAALASYLKKPLIEEKEFIR